MEYEKLIDCLQKKLQEGLENLMEKYMGFCYYIVKNPLMDFSLE